MPRVLSPTEGREVANPQHAVVSQCDDYTRVTLGFSDHKTRKPASLRMTPQMARRIAYLLIKSAARCDGSLIGFDDYGFDLVEPEAAES